MDHGTGTGFRESVLPHFVAGDSDHAAEERLELLLELNAAAARERLLYRDDRERFETSLMSRPVDTQKAFSFFGFLIGSLPPASIALKIVFESSSIRPSVAVFLGLWLLASITTGVVGFQLGKYIPPILSGTNRLSFPNRLACISFIGLVWGAASGAAGGLFLLVIGALFAAAFGAVVGAVTVPVFVFLHQVVRRGDLIELKHFLPIAFAIVLSVCAFILGL